MSKNKTPITDSVPTEANHFNGLAPSGVVDVVIPAHNAAEVIHLSVESTLETNLPSQLILCGRFVVPGHPRKTRLEGSAAIFAINLKRGKIPANCRFRD